jgi:hypothetical protein
MGGCPGSKGEGRAEGEVACRNPAGLIRRPNPFQDLKHIQPDSIPVSGPETERCRSKADLKSLDRRVPQR